MAADCARDCTSPFDVAPEDVALDTALTPPAARDPASDWTLPSRVWPDEAAVDCAWIRPVDTARDREPVEPAVVPELDAVVALPSSTPRP